MMFSKSIVAASAAFSLIVSTSALYDASSPANLAVYWVSEGSHTRDRNMADMK
jgi:hypothetical protein